MSVPRPAVPPSFVKIQFSLTDPSYEDSWDNMRRWLVGQRKRTRLTQAQVAELMGTSQGEVSRFERGLSDPYVSTIARYVRALGLRAHLETNPIEES